MAKQVQFRRGTTSENDSFTGAVGEITVDTTGSNLRVHDGSTAGGAEVRSGLKTAGLVYDSGDVSAAATIGTTGLSAGVYDVVLENLRPSTDNVTIEAQFAKGGTFQTGASDYAFANIRAVRGGSIAMRDNSGADADHIEIMDNVGTGGDEGVSGTLTLSIVDALTGRLSGTVSGEDQANEIRTAIVGGNHSWADTIVDGIRFQASSGNINGRMMIYRREV